MSWRNIQRKNFTSWEKLSEFLELDESHQKKIWKSPKFPLNLPYRLANKIKKNSLSDPILKQFLPSIKEKTILPEYASDPVSDFAFLKEKKLLHKYEGRALLLVSSACAMHCRYCFRQNFDYETEEKGFEKELSLIKEDLSIKEIILSGGDPLSLSNSRLHDLLRKLSMISHVQVIRFHTRFPLGIPERIDEEFLAILSSIPKQIFFIIHVNHPSELDTDIFAALKKIQHLGIPILNQTVLLKGINDDFETLKLLFETLTGQGILPYYLHQLDQVQGAAHFEVDEERGLELIERLKESLPGYAVPRYVKEVPGEKNKTTITSGAQYLDQECLALSQGCAP